MAQLSWKPPTPTVQSYAVLWGQEVNISRMCFTLEPCRGGEKFITLSVILQILYIHGYIIRLINIGLE